MSKILIVKKDITTAPVDAIVNAANPKMLGGGGVDGAIHRIAGPSLLEECRKIKVVNGVRCPIGEARMTSGYNLKAKYVIHTVGPRYGIDDNQENFLVSAYKNSLDLAISNKFNSIAFPAISCGVYGYPAKEAAKIAISVCKRAKYNMIKIHFYLYNDKLFKIWISSFSDSS